MNGAIYRGDFKTGAGAVFIPGAGLPAVGTEYERRHDRLWVAGGASGQVRVYNATTGALLQTYQFTAGEFLNDLVVHRGAVYVTNSNAQQLQVIPLGPGGALPAPNQAFVRPISGDLVYTTGFNANGIASHGRWLFVVQSNKGLLFRVNPATGVATQIDLGGQSVTQRRRRRGPRPAHLRRAQPAQPGRRLPGERLVLGSDAARQPDQPVAGRADDRHVLRQVLLCRQRAVRHATDAGHDVLDRPAPQAAVGFAAGASGAAYSQISWSTGA